MRHLACGWPALLVGLCCLSPAMGQWRSQPAPRPRAAPPVSQYDAVGTLVRNAGSGGSHAPFALIDEAGIVQSYVYPNRDGELDGLVDRRIGVRGSSRTSARDGVPHIWADSAAELGGVRLASREIEPGNAVEVLPPPPSAQPRFSGASQSPSIIESSSPYDAPVRGGAYLEGGMPADGGPMVYDSAMPVEGQVMVDGQIVEGDPSMFEGQYSGGYFGEGAAMPYGQPMPGAMGYGAPMGGWGDPRGGGGWFSGAWIRGEYLYWWTRGMDVPALVTTSPTGTPRVNAGVLGEPGTSVLFGGDSVNQDWRSGLRLRLGVWLDPRYIWGIEAEYFSLEDASTSFAATSPGSPILARPFFDALAGQESAELVAFPNVLSGTVLAEATTRFHGAGLRGLYRICGHDACQGGPCGGGGCCQPQVPGCAYRVDFLLGYRYLRLSDNLTITENLESLDPINPGSFVVHDAFDTENTFHGGDIGTQWTLQRGRWSLEVLTKMAIGVNSQNVSIVGSTSLTENNETVVETGGLLAQRTNIGSYSQDQFSVVPELGLNLGYNITPRLRALAGYTLIYFPNVVRAGNQVDLDVNPNLLPPEADPFTGPLRPAFAFDTVDFWGQGFSLGLDYRF